MITDILERYGPPVVIGGVGGSGTRLVAQLLRELSFFMGSDLNPANDNLWFTLLFKRRDILECPEEERNELLEILFRGMTGMGPFTGRQEALIRRLASADRLQHPAAWLQERVRSLLAVKSSLPAGARWGWKEPNTHVVLDFLRKAVPGLRYIHVMRNGLDMAYSANQNQLELWGGEEPDAAGGFPPALSLAYWCRVHRRILVAGASMGKDFLLINYDEFTSVPCEGVLRLTRFLGIDAAEAELQRLAGLVRIPATVGRFRQHGLAHFAPADVAFVRQLGFAVE